MYRYRVRWRNRRLRATGRAVSVDLWLLRTVIVADTRRITSRLTLFRRVATLNFLATSGAGGQMKASSVVAMLISVVALLASQRARLATPRPCRRSPPPCPRPRPRPGLTPDPVLLGAAAHPTVAKSFGVYTSNKKTNGTNRVTRKPASGRSCRHCYRSSSAPSSPAGCRYEHSQLLRQHEVASETEYECGSGALMSGVTFQGEVVKLE